MKKMLVCLLALCVLVATPALAFEVGDLCPDVDFPLADGENVLSLQDTRGQVTFLVMWATWCPSCVEELPELQRLVEAYPDDVRVVAINCGEDLATVEAFLADSAYTFDVVLDPQYLAIGYLFPTQFIPYTVVLDPDGVIVRDQVGMPKGGYETLADWVETYAIQDAPEA